MQKFIQLCLALFFCGACLRAEAAVPAAPQNLAATSGNAAVSLVWTPPAGTILRYNVYSGLTYTALTTPTTTTTDPWAAMLSLQNGNVYQFAVSAVNADGEGDTAVITAIPAIFPQAPAGVTATAAYDSGWQVRLEWQAAVQGTAPVAGYQIYRSQNSQTPAACAFSAGSGVLYTDTEANTLNAESVYYYWVAAVDQLGNTGAVSAAAEVDVLDALAPAMPESLQATALNGQMGLQWTAGGNTLPGSVDGYYIFYGTAGSAETMVAVPGSTGVSTYALPLANSGETYHFAVAAVKNGRLSARSEAAKRTLPPKVTGLTSFAGSGYFQFAWNPAPGTAGVTAYKLYGMGNTLTTSTTTSAVTTAVYAYYAVAAMNDSGAGEGSNTIAAASPMSVPSPPRDFTVAVGVSQILNFAWPKNPTADAVSEYVLHALDGPFGELPVAPAAGASNTVSVYALTNGQSYRFFLTARNGFGDSPASVTLTAIPMAAPDNLQAVQKNNALALSWEAGDTPSGVSSHALYQVIEGSDAPLSLTRTAQMFHIHHGLASGTYDYQLFAMNDLGQGTTLTVSGTVVAPPLPPSNLSFLPGDGQVQINWVSAADAGAYYLYRSTTKGLYGLPVLAGIQSNVNSASDKGLTNKVKYYYAMSAGNSAGEGARSAEIEVVPFRPASPPAAAPRFSQLRRSIRLEWEAAIPGDYPVIGYNIYRSLDGAIFTLQPSAGGTSPTVEARAGTISAFGWDDLDVDYGGRYIYRLHAVDEDNEGQVWHEGLAYPIISVHIDRPANRLEVWRNAFNPVKGESAPIQLMQVQPGRTWIKVYNLAGEHVRTLFDQDVGQGFSPDNPFIMYLTWDGRNDHGETAASGVYLIHAEGQSNYRQTRKIAIIK